LLVSLGSKGIGNGVRKGKKVLAAKDRGENVTKKKKVHDVGECTI